METRRGNNRDEVAGLGVLVFVRSRAARPSSPRGVGNVYCVVTGKRNRRRFIKTNIERTPIEELKFILSIYEPYIKHMRKTRLESNLVCFEMHESFRAEVKGKKHDFDDVVNMKFMSCSLNKY